MKWSPIIFPPGGIVGGIARFSISAPLDIAGSASPSSEITVAGWTVQLLLHASPTLSFLLSIYTVALLTVASTGLY